MKIVRTKLVQLFRAGAITFYPFVLVDPRFVLEENDSFLRHEGVHYQQQRKWAIYGLGIGLLVWYLLYELVLPVGWNPFRRKWETEAYKEEGYSDEKIAEIMKQPPYYLWW